MATFPFVGYPLILGWREGWLPSPHGIATAPLKDGRFLRCQLADRTQRTMYLGLFEPRASRLVRELLNPGDVFVDVGAHVGWFTTIAAERVGATGQVVAVEPYQPNVAMLRTNIGQNRCRNVRVVEAAAGSGPETATLTLGGDSGAVTALAWAKGDRVVVPMTTLDEITADLEAVTLMKIDVEGWEPHVLRGATRILPRTRHVLIEINMPALHKARSSPEELFALLRHAGFSSFSVVESKVRRLYDRAVRNVLATRPEQVVRSPPFPQEKAPGPTE